MMYVKEKVPQKHIMRYPQFFASRKIIERLEAGGKGGIIWHTHGSGKTGLSAFCLRVISDYYQKSNITARFFFVVDRLDLLRQASIEFQKRNLNVVNCSDRDSFGNLDFTLDTIRPFYQFDVTCMGTVPPAIVAFLEATGFETAIRNAISIGGDSDTLAACTGAIAEAYFGIPVLMCERAKMYLDKRLLSILTEFEKAFPPKIS